MTLIRLIVESVVIGLIALAMSSAALAQRPKRSGIITPPPPAPAEQQATSPR
jgi:hypothetical protein